MRNQQDILEILAHGNPSRLTNGALFRDTRSEVLAHLTQAHVHKIIPEGTLTDLDVYIYHRDRSRLMLAILQYALQKHSSEYQIRSKFFTHNPDSYSHIDADIAINGKHHALKFTVNPEYRSTGAFTVYMPGSHLKYIVRQFREYTKENPHSPDAMMTGWIREFFRTHPLPSITIYDENYSIPPGRFCYYVSGKYDMK